MGSKIDGTKTTGVQYKNIAWFLPRPKPDHYKGGMPLHAEKWLLKEANSILGKSETESTVLNLFCGMNTVGFRVDIKPEVKPDLLCNAHDLSPLGNRTFDIILADPPYSNEESAEIYGTPKLNYKKWTKEATKHLGEKGILIVYHKYVMPNPDSDIYTVVRRVFIGNRPYHLPRVAIYFQKKSKNRSIYRIK